MILKEIGKIKSPYKVKGEAPRQGRLSKEIMKLIVNEEYKSAMKDLESIEYIVVLYWGNRADRDILIAEPPGSGRQTGVFSCRSPNRPNPIALCVARILDITDNVITVVGLDALDESPLLDIKPYVKLVDDSKS
jgi:formylmethanofuran dehydrogenase subunit E